MSRYFVVERKDFIESLDKYWAAYEAKRKETFDWLSKFQEDHPPLNPNYVGRLQPKWWRITEWGISCIPRWSKQPVKGWKVWKKDTDMVYADNAEAKDLLKQFESPKEDVVLAHVYREIAVKAGLTYPDYFGDGRWHWENDGYFSGHGNVSVLYRNSDGDTTWFVSLPSDPCLKFDKLEDFTELFEWQWKEVVDNHRLIAQGWAAYEHWTNRTEGYRFETYEGRNYAFPKDRTLSWENCLKRERGEIVCHPPRLLVDDMREFEVPVLSAAGIAKAME